MEGDLLLLGQARGELDFYPRPPGGGRPMKITFIPATMQISIHALRVEGDILKINTFSKFFYFYPRPPGGGRQRTDRPQAPGKAEFLSTPSEWRATSN